MRNISPDQESSHFHWTVQIYHRAIPKRLREKIKLWDRLVAVKYRVAQTVNVAGVIAAHRLDAVRSQFLRRVDVRVTVGSNPERSLSDLDFVNAMVHHNPCAVGVANQLKEVGLNSVVVAVMEEAATTAWLAQAELRFPYIVSLHTMESLCMQDIYPRAARFKAEKWLLSAACNEAKVVTFPSQGCGSDFLGNFAATRADVRRVFNPVDCARIRWLSFHRCASVETWRAAAPCFRMVHVGRLDPQKNHGLLLEACAVLKARNLNFSLAIVGEGSGRIEIETQILKLGLGGFVHLAGEQLNPFPWIACANALILTSRFEAFALVLVEAMVCGTPVVSVDCPTGPAEVLNNGEYGLLVPNDDPCSIADAIERLIDEPMLSERLIEGGFHRAQAFDVKAIVPQWEALFNEVP